MEWQIYAIQASILIVTTVVIYFYYKFKNFPPGPWGIPFMGYGPFLGANPHIALRDLGKKYGRILSVNMGSVQTVVVSDWESVREVLVKQGDTFGARPFVFTLHTTLQKRENDILTTNGPVTKELKRISGHILKELGMGRSSMEPMIVEEVEKLATFLRKMDGQLVDVGYMFFIPLMNVIWKMTSGVSLEMDDPTMKSFSEALHLVTGKGHAGILNMCPMLRYVAPELSGYTSFANASKKIFGYIDRVVEEHIASEDEAAQKTDFMQYFIEEIKSHRKDNVPDQAPYCKNNLGGAAFDMFAAGVETMDTNLMWAVLLMAYFPEAQAKVHEELDKNLAIDSHLSYTSSRNLTPFTEATLCEIGRFASISPFAAPHCAAKDATLLGYKIPKGTTILTNLWALDHDEKYWGDPEVFRPERFLDEEGRPTKHERFIPFSLGPRMCLGEPMAKMQLTLFFNCLMRRFSFHLDPNLANRESVLQGNVGILIRPHPLSLIVKCRS